MISKRSLLFCCLMCGQLLAMESDRSQSFEKKIDDSYGLMESELRLFNMASSWRGVGGGLVASYDLFKLNSACHDADKKRFTNLPQEKFLGIVRQHVALGRALEAAHCEDLREGAAAFVGGGKEFGNWRDAQTMVHYGKFLSVKSAAQARSVLLRYIHDLNFFKFNPYFRDEKLNQLGVTVQWVNGLQKMFEVDRQALVRLALKEAEKRKKDSESVR